MGQMTGGVVMALGNATLEGTVYGADGRQRNASLLDYKLLTTRRRTRDRGVFVEHPASNGGPRGSKGVGEPPIVPTAGAVGNAIASRTGTRVRRLPMTPERVWRAITTGDDGAAEANAPFGPARRPGRPSPPAGSGPDDAAVRRRRRRSRPPSRSSPADAAARPVAGGTDLVVAARQGRKPLPESIVAIDRIAELDQPRGRRRRARPRRLTSHAWLADSAEVRDDAGRRSPTRPSIVGSPATRATGTIGGNLMNASPAAETTAPLVVLDANVMLRAIGRRLADRPGRGSRDGARPDVGRRRASC